MAIIQNPVIGRARKQAGGMVFSKMYDKNVMRAKPASVTPSNTVAQQGQRAFITKLTGLAKGFTPDDLIRLYPSKPASRSRYSELQKQLSAGRTVTGAVASIDFTKVPVLGNGIDVPIEEPIFTLQPTVIEVEWGSTEVPPQLNATDKAFCVVFNTTIGQAIQTQPAQAFQSQNQQINYPSGWTSAQDYHVYLGFVATKFKPGSELSSTVKKVEPI